MPRATILSVERILLVTLHDDQAFAQDEDFLTPIGDAIVEAMARGVLIDVSALSLVDSYMARVLGQMTGMSKLLGVGAIIAGMRPEVAIAMVELGIDLPAIATVMTVDAGLARLRRQIGSSA